MARILVIEDDLCIAEVLRDTMHYLGHTAALATNGHAAAQILKSFVPAIAFLDLSLPDIDGRVLLQQLRKSLLPHDIPVILITGTELDSGELPPDSYQEVIPKPFDIREVMTVATRFLEKEKAGACV